MQFLVRSLDSLQDGSKFSFAGTGSRSIRISFFLGIGVLCTMFSLCLLIDQVKSIHELVYSWRKMELRSWPALLDEVQDQYEINAGKVNHGLGNAQCGYLHL